MIYFDNAATSFPKPKCVVDATYRCIKKYCANPGRSAHKLAIMTSERVYEAREKIANFIGIKAPEKILFTQNATHALNLAIKTTVKPDTHVLISDLEHNAVLRPINRLKDTQNVEYSVFSTLGSIEENIKSLIRENTKYIVTTLASNVIGRTVSLEELSAVAKKYGLILIVDASQLIGHKVIDIGKYPCNILCAPGHKALFGIQGVGFAVINDDIAREAFIYGGTGSDSLNLNMPSMLPERYEAGTLPSPAIVSVAAGIDYIESVGISAIEEKINVLTERCEYVVNEIKNVVTYESGNGIISFNVSGVPAQVISEELAQHGICTRCGLHCAPLAHQTIGTVGIGTVRISLSYLNKIREIDVLYKVLSALSKKYA